MEDKDKTKDELIRELVKLRQRVAGLEKAETRYQHVMDMLQDSRAIFETTGTATIIIDEDTTISLANTEFEKLSGYSKQELENKRSWTEFVAGEHLERMKEYHYLRRRCPDKAPKNYEFQFITRKGEIKDIFLTVKVIPGTNKSIASLLDITERKKVEEEFRRSEERYQQLTQAAQELIIMHDIEGNITYANRAAAEKTGYPVDELLQMNVYDLIAPEERERVRELEMRRKQGDSSVYFLEMKTLKKNGSIYQVEINSSLIPGPVKPEGILVVARDITERKKAEEKLAQERNLLQALIDNIPDHIYFKDCKNQFVRVNKAKARFSGTTPKDMIGKTDFDLLLEEQAKEAFVDDKRVLKSQRPLIDKVQKITDKQGREYWFSITKLPRHNTKGKLVGTMGISRDITEHRRREKELAHMATHDTLTDLPNRALFNDRFFLALAQAERNRKQFSVMMLDLDNFKNVNDTLGHSGGDKILRAAGERLKNLLRKTDTIARMGGDEFLLLLPNTSDRKNATIIAQRILAIFQKPFLCNDQEVTTTVSIGIAIYPGDGESSDTLIKNADIAMYHAKQKGRDTYQYHIEISNAEKIR